MYAPSRMVPPRSDTSRCDCISEMTGVSQSGSNSVLLVSGRWQTLRANSMIATCSPRQMPKNGRSFSRAQRTASTIPSMPRSPNPPGMSSPSQPPSRRLAARLIGELIAGDPLDLDPGLARDAAVNQRLLHRLVGVVQVGVLPDHGDPHPVGRMQDPLGHDLPGLEVGLLGLQPEPLAHLAVEALLEEAERDLVDRLHVRALDHAAEVHVAEERDLALDVRRERLLAPADQDVGLDSDLHQLAHRVLGRLGLELAGRRDVRAPA